jgi:hypothetical protein
MLYTVFFYEVLKVYSIGERNLDLRKSRPYKFDVG